MKINYSEVRIEARAFRMLLVKERKKKWNEICR